MAKLSDYLKAKLSQERVLKSSFAFKKDAQAGVCMALCTSWFLLLASGEDDQSYDEMIEAILKDFDRSIVKQSMFDDAAFDVANDAAASQVWNTVSPATGVHFTFKTRGKLVDPFKKALFSLADGCFMMELKFDGDRGHAIGVARFDADYIIFDPNLGIFEVSSGQIDDFASLLWAGYKSLGMNVESWRFYSMRRAQTAKQRMEAALGRLT